MRRTRTALPWPGTLSTYARAGGSGRARKSRKAGLDQETYGNLEAGRIWAMLNTLNRVAAAIELAPQFQSRGEPTGGR